MDSLGERLYVSYDLSQETSERLQAWSDSLAVEPVQTEVRWHLHLQRYMRSVTVTRSTNIEGNPMSPPQVDALLSGDPVDAPQQAQLEVLNYNRALNLATTFAQTETHEWQESTVAAINSTIMQGLPNDEQGRYRRDDVTVAGVYQAPAPYLIRQQMADLITWLRACDDHPLVRVALLHLNLVAVHPFLDGNGRAARVLSSLELMRSGVRAPELVSIEPYLAANREEYFERLHTTIGASYSPDRHSATEWVEYYVRVSAGMLDNDRRLDEAWPHDFGMLADVLSRRGQPLDWAPILHMAAYSALRTREVADVYDRSLQWSRARLNAVESAGWIRHEGRTRGTRWLATDQLMALDLRIPSLMRQFEQGLTLGLNAA